MARSDNLGQQRGLGEVRFVQNRLCLGSAGKVMRKLPAKQSSAKPAVSLLVIIAPLGTVAVGKC